MLRKLKLVLADDHPLIRKGLRQGLESQPMIHSVHEAENGEDALIIIRREEPDIAILDIEMPRMDGYQVARTIQQENLPVSVVFLTMYKEEHFFNKALDIGVAGYILKENALSEIVQCLQLVAEGKHYISPVLAEYLVHRSNRKDKSVPHSLETLTQTERKVLKLLAEMKTSQQIADELFISVNTVSNHRHNISEKLGLHGSHTLLKFALENKDSL